MAAFNQCQWLFNILEEYGFKECVKAFKDNMDTLRYKVKYENALSDIVRQAEVTTIGRDEYIKNTVASYEKVMRDSIRQARSADVYKVVPIIYNYALAEAVRDKLLAMLTKHAETETGDTSYPQNLLHLFHGNSELIDQLAGLDDNAIANNIRIWSRGKDKLGRPLIENPGNSLKKAFAVALKDAGLIAGSADSFRQKL